MTHALLCTYSFLILFQKVFHCENLWCFDIQHQKVFIPGQKYIYPFRDSVDYKIDSMLDYEGCVFHHYILPMLGEMKDDSVFAGKVRQIVEILEAFDDIDYSYIPENSLLREFIG